jgi:hypothetical protein
MSVSDFDEVVINLNILASINPNKKLITKETYLNVEVQHMVIPEFLKRWYRGDGRNEGIKKIDSIIVKALKILNEYPEIEQYLTNSIKGIDNLKATYSSDVQTVARLNTIIEKINRGMRNETISVSSNNSITYENENSESSNKDRTFE